MISFEHPAALALCLVPPAMALFAYISRKASRRRIMVPLDIWNGPTSIDASGPWRTVRSLSTLLFGLAWMALSVAAAGPAQEERASMVTKSGLDVVFILDTSPSMAAMDLEPTRLGAAKALVKAFVDNPEGAAGAAVGVTAFGAEAALVCPPTTDYATVSQRLEAVEPGVLGDGTAIGQGLSSALRQIVASGSKKAAAVLLSDGEDNVGLIHPNDAAAAFARLGTTLIVVGLGTKGDVPIEYVDPATGERMSGEYRSGFSEEVLSSLARLGGGEYRSAVDSRSLSALLSELVRLDAQSDRSSLATNPVRRSLGRPLILAAMMLVALAWSLRRLVLGGLA